MLKHKKDCMKILKKANKVKDMINLSKHRFCLYVNDICFVTVGNYLPRTPRQALTWA